MGKEAFYCVLFRLYEGKLDKGIQSWGVVAGNFQDAMNKVVAKCAPGQAVFVSVEYVMDIDVY